MRKKMSKQAVIQNLKDAGCTCKTVEKFLSYEEEGKLQEQLDKVHREERQISCLDYLVYQLQNEIVQDEEEFL